MKNTASVFSQDSQLYFSRSTSPFSEAKENRASTATLVTPSPKTKGISFNKNNGSSLKIDSAEMPFVKDDGTWRSHGKLFRASIVSVDEESGGNMFALSDSCAIERYYRVADRVLEQFLSSNIAERDELIETYVVGNRLFKFLSVVLPTHHQYFSSDPRLEELRHCSESQLMELLEYMEILELMIDEMEYNRYILKDLRPSETIDTSRGTNIATREIAREGLVGDEIFLHSSTEKKQIDSRDNNRVAIAAKRNMPVQGKEISSEKQQQKQTEQNVAYRFSQSNGTCRKPDDSPLNVMLPAIESLDKAQKRSKSNIVESPNHHEMLRQRVAAVVEAKSRSENSTAEKISTQPLADSFPHVDSFDDFQYFSPNDFESRGLFHDTYFHSSFTETSKPQSELERHEVDREPLHESPQIPQMSWDADFSQFNVFSEKSDGEKFSGSNANSFARELSLHDSSAGRRKQYDRSKTLPKIKEPPVPYPRSVWDHAQVQNAARLSFPIDEHKFHSDGYRKDVRTTSSDCSSDIFQNIQDSRPNPEPMKTRIEERLECASRGVFPSGEKKGSFAITQHENSTAFEANSNRKLLNQFRGCVRFLLD